MRISSLTSGLVRGSQPESDYAYINGVPQTILYDNATTLVARVVRGRDREETAGFLALRAHYGFAADFCRPGIRGAHEKGGVENGVGWARRNLLVPVPVAASWDALNADLATRSQARRQKAHSRQEGTVGDWAAREQAHLLALPPVPFACCQVTPVRVNRYAMVTYDRVRYSVPTRHVGRTLLLKAFVDRVEVVDGVTPVATHARAYTPKMEVLAAEHYVELLAQKPSAVAHARVFRTLSEPYAAFRLWCLAQRPPATREFVAVLRLWQEFPADTVAAALRQSMAAGVYRAAAVRQLCLRARPEDAPPPPLVGPWATRPAPVIDLTHFDQLLCIRRASS